MGTSVAMIEPHYGTLIGEAPAGIAGRLDALETELEKALREEFLGWVCAGDFGRF
jgi:hypothetical protein